MRRLVPFFSLLCLCSSALSATFSASNITNPVPNSTFTSTNITFNWNDSGSPYYYLYLGNGPGSNNYYNSGQISTTSLAVSGVPTGVVVYARLWTKVDDIPTNFSYWVKDFIFNIDADNDGIVDSIDPHPGVYDEPLTVTSTNFSITILGSGRVANMLVSQATFDAMAIGDSSAYMAPLCQMVLAYFDDVFDMIFLTSDQDTAPGAPYAGQHWGIRNDTLGLGKSIYDNSASYGSTGKLQSVIHFTAKGAVAGGPSLHEMMHRWANDLASVPTTVSGHWGFAGIPGQLGGWDPATFASIGGGQYQANNGRAGSTSFGTFANGGNGLPYADFELYLMGMIPTNGLQDILIAQNPATVDSANGIFSATGISTVTVAQVVATDGARVPGSASSQKSFRIIHVILSVAPLTNTRWIDYDKEVYNFALAGSDGQSLYNFWEATGGQGTLVMDGLKNALRRPSIFTVASLAASNGMPQISFTAKSRVQYAFERSTNLLTWQSVMASISSTGSVITVSDPGATNLPAAFYRIRLQ